MSYLKEEEFNLLNKDFPNWQQEAFENLRYSGECFYTNFRTDEATGALSFIIFSNDDGIGSSRILLSGELSKGFPEGYYIAMPDRAYGLAISKNISASERQVLETIITEYYGCTGTAMTKLIMEPSGFLLPEKWAQPLNQEISNWLIKEIRSYKEQ